MQHLNYFTLRALARALHQQWAGGRILQVFSQEKDTLVLLAKGRGRASYLEAACGPPLAWLVPRVHMRRSRRNVADLFPEVLQATILQVGLVPLERTLYLMLRSETAAAPSWLLYRMHGTRSDVLLLQPGQPLQRFRHDMHPKAAPGTEAEALAPLSALLTEAALGPEVAWQQLLAAERAQLARAQSQLGSERSPEALRRALPMLDAVQTAHVLTRMQSGLPLLGAVAPLYGALTLDRWYLGRQRGRTVFSLLPPEGQEPAALTPVEGVLPALERWLQLELRARSYGQLREDAWAALAARRETLQQQIQQLETRQQHLAQTRPPEELGHLLLAGSTEYRPGMVEITLPDHYHAGEALTLKLDPALNLQQNAERYYARHREWIGQQQALVQQQQALAEALPRLEAAEQALRTATRSSQLREVLQRYPELAPAQPRAPTPLLPYRELQYAGYTLRIGRNARANDQLTFRHSRKQDWWLHARDGSGAHVVVQSRGETQLPLPVREYAARLAAGYGQAQHSALAPVLLTRVKYVRKRKGMPPGAVEPMQTETLLVAPLRL